MNSTTEQRARQIVGWSESLTSLARIVARAEPELAAAIIEQVKASKGGWCARDLTEEVASLTLSPRRARARR